jgi:hypothetical protein
MVVQHIGVEFGARPADQLCQIGIDGETELTIVDRAAPDTA